MAMKTQKREEKDLQGLTPMRFVPFALSWSQYHFVTRATA